VVDLHPIVGNMWHYTVLYLLLLNDRARLPKKEIDVIGKDNFIIAPLNGIRKLKGE